MSFGTLLNSVGRIDLSLDLQPDHCRVAVVFDRTLIHVNVLLGHHFA